MTKERIEFLVEVEIEHITPMDRDLAIKIAMGRMQIADGSRGWALETQKIAQLTREQSRAVRMVSAVAQNAGSVPGTMEEVSDGSRAILGHPEAPYFAADSRGQG